MVQLLNQFIILLTAKCFARNGNGANRKDKISHYTIAMVEMVLTVTLCPLTCMHTHTYISKYTYTLYAGAHLNAIVAKFAQILSAFSIFTLL